jgi:hypothetical protein
MRLSTFYRRGFSGPLATAPADRTATPWNRRAPANTSHKNPIKFATSLGFCESVFKERTGLEVLRPPVRVSPSFGALAPANPGDSPPAPAKLRPFTRPPHPPALRR